MSAADTPPGLVKAAEAAAMLICTERHFNRLVADGRIPSKVFHPLTYGQSKHRLYIRRQLELFIEGELTP